MKSSIRSDENPARTSSTIRAASSTRARRIRSPSAMRTSHVWVGSVARDALLVEVQHHGLGIDHYAFAREHETHGRKQDREIEVQAAVQVVPDVETEALVPGDEVAAVDLRPSGDPRRHAVAKTFAVRIEG